MTLPSPPSWWSTWRDPEARRRAQTLRALAAARVEASDVPRFDGPNDPKFQNFGSIRLGEQIVFRSWRLFTTLATGPQGRLEIGDRAFLNDGVNLYSAVRIVIGAESMLADEAIVFDTTFHALAPDRPARTAPVVIGRNVWIGVRAIVLPGVTIGDHAVIGAGAIVTSDIPARSVAAGNPARVLRTFDCPDDWRRT